MRKGSRKMKAGARIRTADLLITNQLLYRLSYASVPGLRVLRCITARFTFLALSQFPTACPAASFFEIDGLVVLECARCAPEAITTLACGFQASVCHCCCAAAWRPGT